MNLRQLRVDNFAFRVFLAVLAIAPIFYYGGIFLGRESLRIGQEQFFQLGVQVLFAIAILENIYLAGLLLWGVFLYSFFGFEGYSGKYLMMIFFGCVMYQVAYKLVTNENFKRIPQVMMWLAFVNIVFMILQSTGNDVLYKEYGKNVWAWDLVGVMGLKAFSGMFLAMCIPFALQRGYVVPVALMFPIILSECSVAVLGAVIAFLWHIYNRINGKAVLIALLLICSFGVGAYIWKDSKAGMMDHRTELWKVVMRDSLKHPLVGHGLDSFRAVSERPGIKNWMYFKNVRTKESFGLAYHRESGRFIMKPDKVSPGDTIDPWDHAHNEYINAFFTMGCIPLIIFVALVRDIRKRFTSYSQDAIAIVGFFLCIAVFSIGQFPFHVVRIGVFIPVMLAAYYKLTEAQGVN